MAAPNREARPSFFPELEDLENDATAIAGRLKAAEAASAEASGRDSSGQVRVVLAALGRITAVEVRPGWRSRIDSGDLSAAVLAAFQDAGIRRLETWSAEIARADVSSGPTVQSTLPGSVVGSGSGPADESSQGSIRKLFYLLQDATDRLDDVVCEAAARSRTVVTGRNLGGHVVVTLSGGGELTGVTVEETWAVGADAREIGAAVTAAIVDGYAVVDRCARESTSQWPFPDLDRLSGSPTALLATLGLPGVAADDTTRKD